MSDTDNCAQSGGGDVAVEEEEDVDEVRTFRNLWYCCENINLLINLSAVGKFEPILPVSQCSILNGPNLPFQ